MWAEGCSHLWYLALPRWPRGDHVVILFARIRRNLVSRSQILGKVLPNLNLDAYETRRPGITPQNARIQKKSALRDVLKAMLS